MRFLRGGLSWLSKLESCLYPVQAALPVSTSRRLPFCTAPAQNDMPSQIENPFEREKPKCILCQMNITPDYKNVKLLSQFVSPYTGIIYGRHVTGLCRKKQEILEREIKKSQHAGFMPYYCQDPAFSDGPKLFNPDRPFRPHNF